MVDRCFYLVQTLGSSCSPSQTHKPNCKFRQDLHPGWAALPPGPPTVTWSPFICVCVIILLSSQPHPESVTNGLPFSWVTACTYPLAELDDDIGEVKKRHGWGLWSPQSFCSDVSMTRATLVFYELPITLGSRKGHRTTSLNKDSWMACWIWYYFETFKIHENVYLKNSSKLSRYLLQGKLSRNLLQGNLGSIPRGTW